MEAAVGDCTDGMWGAPMCVWDRPCGGLDIPTLSEPWSRADVVDFPAYCRERAAETLEGLTDEQASTRIGRKQEPYVGRVIDKMGRVIEHGAQIRQFITAADPCTLLGPRRLPGRPWCDSASR